MRVFSHPSSPVIGHPSACGGASRSKWSPRPAVAAFGGRLAAGLVAVCCAAGLLSAPGAAGEATSSAASGIGGRCAEVATVVRVTDAHEIVLDRAIAGAETVRLAGIEAPRPAEPDERSPQGRPPARTLADEALRVVRDACEGRRVCLSAKEPASIDRYGRLLAHVYGEDGTWLQGLLLSRGLARVRTTREAADLALDMLDLEREARDRRLGMWRYREFRVRPAGEAGRFIGSFQVIEGRVLEVAHRRSFWYLNFGEDWRSDFTIGIPQDVLSASTAAAFDPLALKGQPVRVRGWIEKYNGPMIEIDHLAQIERLPPGDDLPR